MNVSDGSRRFGELRTNPGSLNVSDGSRRFGELRTNPGVGRIPICNNVGVKQRHCQNHNYGKNEFHFHLHKPPCIYDMWASIPVFTSLLSLFH